MRISTAIFFILFISHSYALTYCIPNPSNGVNGHTITSIQLESINTAGSGVVSYTFNRDSLSTLTCYLRPGIHYDLIVVTGSGHTTSTCAAWIDYNNDTTLSSSEKLGEFNSNQASDTGTIGFTVPTNSVKGKLRLRVRCSNSTSIGACSNYSSGETTDFTITILDPNYDYNFFSGWEYTSTGTSYIDAVNFQSIHNLNTGSPDGPLYHDFSSHSTNVSSCNLINMSLTTVTPTSLNNRAEVYVDINDDGSFEQTNELVGTLLPDSGIKVTTTQISIPSVTGTRRMRIIYFVDVGICEIEDYTVNVTASTVTASPQAVIGSDLFSVCTSGCNYIACPGSNSFTDYSCGNPTSWLWVVPGATPDSSTNRNPSFNLSIGTYNVTLIASNGSGSDTDYATVTVEAPFINFSLGSDTSLCSGGGLNLHAPNPGSPSDCYNYTWSTGSNANQIHITSSGTYSVTVEKCDHSGCAATDAINVTISPLSYSVTGGGSFCVSNPGSTIGLNDSETGVEYQLKLNGVDVGVPVAGTGHAISFGNQLSTGTYTVVATNLTTSCTSTMQGNAVIQVSPTPSVFNVTGGGTVCSGSGAPVGLDGSENNVEYQLYRNGNSTGSPINGNGGTISFPNQSTSGTYTVIATGQNSSCSDTMNGSVSVSAIAAPSIYNVTGGGNFCGGTAVASVGLSDTENGVIYLLHLDSAATGDTLIGTGSPMNFTQLLQSGIYTIVASNGTTCVSTMHGSASLTIKPAPILYDVSPGGTYCIGGNPVIISVDSSQTGINYRLWVAGFPSGGVIPGTGSAISFPGTINTGTFYVIATNTANGCTATMNGTAVIVEDSFPDVYNVLGGGHFCIGNLGAAVSLDNSDTSVTYSLYRDGDTIGINLPGTGSTLSFGTQNIGGLYTVVATSALSCSLSMSDSAVVVVDPLPVISITTVLTDTICIFNSPIPLAGSPSGGVFTGSGVVHDTLFPQIAGAHKVVITYSYTEPVSGCSADAFDSVMIDMCIGIDEYQLPGTFYLYPNPVDEQVTTEFNINELVDLSIELKNVVGETIKYFSPRKVSGHYSLKINTSDISPGIYFIKMNINDGCITRKISVYH